MVFLVDQFADDLVGMLFIRWPRSNLILKEES